MVVVVLPTRRKRRTKSGSLSSCSHRLNAWCLLVWAMASSIMVISGSSAQENKRGSSDFYTQRLSVPFAGQHTGVAVFDLNGDGYLDLLFSSGRHWVDQSFIIINLGIDPDMPEQYRFSKEYPIGKPGGYYQVDASTLSSMMNHTAVLLAGSICYVESNNEFGSCEFGSTGPAVLLDVMVQGCSVYEPHEPCRVEWKEVWREPNPKGNRNGAFAASLGDGTDPAIVLVGMGGISIFEPKKPNGSSSRRGTGTYYDHFEPTLMILPDDHLTDDQVVVDEDHITRSTGLAVGYLGDYWPGIIVGPRTMRSVYPAPLIAVYKDKYSSNQYNNKNNNNGEEYDWYDFGDARYSGDLSKAPQPSGLVLADLNGDGYFDIVQANDLDPPDIQAGYGLDQNYYLLDQNGYGRPSRIFTAPHGGRSVHAGNIYNDSEFPDLAFGDSDGNVILFANLGNDNRNTGVFLGFEQRDVFQVSLGCEVRGIKIASLSPCSVSILAAATCLNGEVLDERQNSNRAIHRIDPTGQSCLPGVASSSQRTPPPTGAPPPLTHAYPVDNPPKLDGAWDNSPAASLGQAASSAPRVVPVKTLRYQYVLIGGFAGALLFWLH